ncbi:MAG: RNA methyltransferase [Bacillota bacterium]|nr:RNA methyltransferase [Bacillota bacterium]
MPIKEISSSNNASIKEYRRLAGSRKYRRSAGKLALEGPHLVKEALATGLLPEVVFVTRSFLDSGGEKILSVLPGGTRQYLLSPSLFAGLAHTETPQEVAAIVPFREPGATALLSRPLTLVLILDCLQDPGNMGTIIRTAAAAGVEALFYSRGCVDPYNPKALRSTAGALFHLPLAVVEDPRQLVKLLQHGGMTIVAAQPQAGQCYWEVDYRRKTGLLIGSESRGLSPGLIAAADFSVFIPQFSSLDSLNAAIAAAVIIYEALRQRSS